MTNQSRPLFAVNEVVIICEPREPEHNTEQTILEIDWSEDFDWSDDPSDEPKPACWMYQMEGESDFMWCEGGLRKKYPPSSQSFSELMNSLKTPAKIS